MPSSRHRAGWVMVEPDVWLENGVVEVTDGRIASVDRASPMDDAVDYGPGVILPALINAHTHLSLSALVGKVGTSRGFLNWVKGLIQSRAELSDHEMRSAAVTAAASARDAGTGFMLEVGPVEPGATAMRMAGLEGAVLAEVLGQCPELPDIPNSVNGLSFSYAGHALHTTAPRVLQGLKQAAGERGLFSIHMAEADVEMEFLATGNGSWADFLGSRRIEHRDWGPWGERPVARANRLGLLGPDTLAVHVLHANSSDIETLAATGTPVCVCPRSNSLLHGRLPDITAFLEAGLTCALGTDSLASCPTLSLFDEMFFVFQRYPDLRPEAILALATTHAAKAVARPDLGSLRVGQKARLIYVDLVANSADMAALNLVSGRFGRMEWL
jgi:cytosine/adenosine deaminase-related metal-dependent hydrolase